MKLQYTPLFGGEGLEFFSKIRTMFLTNDPHYYIEPFSNQSLRYRCIIEKHTGISAKIVVYFHIGDDEVTLCKDLQRMPDTICFYGAYNQVTVCQMKSVGKIREMMPSEKSQFVRLIQDRFSGKEIGDTLPIMPNDKEVAVAIEKLSTGTFYCYEPFYFSCNVYQRF